MKNQVIELENGKKYAVAETITLDGNNYLYIVNIDDNKELHFAEVNGNKIDFVKDDNLFDLLMFEVFKKNVDNF